jgi:hypothetical protein
MLLTTGEVAVPGPITVLPGAPSSIAVSVYGNAYYNGRGVFILDDGQPRANFVQPPEVVVNVLTSGPPGYVLGATDYNDLIVLRLGTAGATLESYGGLVGATGYNRLSSLLYAGGVAYASTGEAVDLTNPDAPLAAGRFPVGGDNCTLASRSATRIMMFCPGSGADTILHLLDTTTFTRVGSLTLPVGLPVYGTLTFTYVGGDAVAALGGDARMQIVHAPMIGSPP